MKAADVYGISILEVKNVTFSFLGLGQSAVTVSHSQTKMVLPYLQRSTDVELLTVWLPPAVIIAVILFTNNLTNKRIDDLRSQVKQVESKLDSHISNYEVHKTTPKW